ncbi:MAG: hypothetical protein ABSG90_10210 [Dehalococcoidia bacterium]|jgi:hypothetical protein
MHDQLYYPNLEPKLSRKLCISLLHWDHLIRIYPIEGSALFRPSRGVLHDLEKENLLINEPLEDSEIEQATRLFEKIMRTAGNKKDPASSVARSLIRPVTTLSKKLIYRSNTEYPNYGIYKGKTNGLLHKVFPKYFYLSEDSMNNEIFLCTKETGLTYMTLLAYFLNRRKKYSNTITDQNIAFPLFIALNRNLHFVGDADLTHSILHNGINDLIERIFYIPLYSVLEPVKFEGDRTIEKILTFRRERDNEKLRQSYLKCIDLFLSDIMTCKTDKELIEMANKHDLAFQNNLKMLISACEAKGIPVNKKIINHGHMDGWEIASCFWDAACKVTNVITLNLVSIIKPLLRLKPAIDFYNNTISKSDYYYPLLIQESFSPTYAQRVFSRLRQLDQIEFNLPSKNRHQQGEK